MSIEWKNGAVCFAVGIHYSEIDFNLSKRGGDYGYLIDAQDFQLNEMREGDYIKASELDTEQKYNDAVEAFGLFGAKWGLESCTEFSDLDEGDILIWSSTLDQGASWHVQRKRKITYPQLMAIGKLKRAMIEREGSAGGRAVGIPDNTAEFDAIVSGKLVDTASTGRRNKSKQAYDILKSLDYEYDLVKQRWYKKEWM